MHYVSTEGDRHILVIEKLGPSLEQLRKRCNQQFSLNTTMRIGEQMVYLNLNFRLAS